MATNLLWMFALIPIAVLTGFLGYYLALNRRVMPLASKLAEAEERSKSAESVNLDLRKHFGEMQTVSAENMSLRIKLAIERVARTKESQCLIEVGKWKEIAIKEKTAREEYKTAQRLLLQTRVEAAENRARLEAEKEIRGRFKVETHYNRRVDGWAFKKYFLDVRYRLVFDNIPITPWILDSRQIDARIDEAELKVLAEAASSIIKTFIGNPLPEITKNVVRRISTVISDAVGDSHTNEASVKALDQPPAIDSGVQPADSKPAQPN